MSLAEVERDAGLAAAVEEVRRTALAVGVVLGKSVAHLTVALHLSAAHTSADISVHTGECAAVSSPEVSLVNEDVIVISELVALLHHGIRIVEVILYLLGVLVVCAEGIVVEVVELCGSKQVVHRLIVHTLGGAEVKSHHELRLLRQVHVESG